MKAGTKLSPWVSVIIPTYNRSAFLQEAIQSVADQTYRPIECIVVDDGSTDNTKETVEKFIAKNTDQLTVQYLPQPNAGAQVARNTGTAASSGAYIQYLDSDDLLYAGKIQSQVSFLLGHPECDAVFGDWEEGVPGNIKKITAYKNDNLLVQILTQRAIHTLSPLMRSSFVKKIGPWDVNIRRNQEIDFHLRGVLAGGNFEYQPFTTGLWRLHLQERIGNATKFADAIYFYRKWEEELRGRHLWNESFSKGIVNNYMWFLGNYPNSPDNQIVSLLREMHRLQPLHPVFTNPKFRMIKKVLGFDNAAKLWVARYKKNKAAAS